MEITETAEIAGNYDGIGPCNFFEDGICGLWRFGTQFPQSMRTRQRTRCPLASLCGTSFPVPRREAMVKKSGVRKQEGGSATEVWPLRKGKKKGLLQSVAHNPRESVGRRAPPGGSLPGCLPMGIGHLGRVEAKRDGTFHDLLLELVDLFERLIKHSDSALRDQSRQRPVQAYAGNLAVINASDLQPTGELLCVVLVLWGPSLMTLGPVPFHRSIQPLRLLV